MIEEKYLQTARNSYLHNEHWGAVYKNAPSDKCREYLDLEFFFSLYGRGEQAAKEFQEARKEKLPELSLEDLEFLCRVNGNNPGRRIYKEAMKKFGGAKNCNICQKCMCRRAYPGGGGPLPSPGKRQL